MWTNMTVPIEMFDGKLTEFDYGFLKGDKVMWPSWGAALGVVMEFCRRHGLGEFGEPTEYGLVAMKRYEESQ